MKFGKLDLNKQSVARLTQSETTSVIGGGKNRSDRNNGDCAYSRKHGEVLDYKYDTNTYLMAIDIDCAAKNGNNQDKVYRPDTK